MCVVYGRMQKGFGKGEKRSNEQGLIHALDVLLAGCVEVGNERE